MTVRKAVVPVAGFGTRFLPVTRAVPKNALPVFDRPSIHFCVEEAAAAGIEEIIFVVSDNQEAIPRYFEEWPALEGALEGRGNSEMLEQMRRISGLARINCVTQSEQKGLGHAVLMARDAVGDEPFAVFLPDDVIWADRPTIGGMIRVYEETGCCVIAVKEVPDEAVPNLGIVDVEPVDETTSRIFGMVEKPRLEDAPSNLAIIGRYVFGPEVFGTLERVRPGALGEIQLTDAIAAHIEAPGVRGYHFTGEHFDVGTPLGMLKASVAAALRREDIESDLRSWLLDALAP
jgi:UTP--glucose-1-phosphate uridylyltransferase